MLSIEKLKNAKMDNLKFLLLFVFYLLSPNLSMGQDSKEDDKISNRIFMPSIQMGYINNHSDNLSGGILIQTSLEYQTKKGIFFRINYDDFDADYELNDLQNSSGVFGGKVSFAELIGGLGYRLTKKKHNVFLATQMGYRFYGHPVVSIENNTTQIKFDNREVLINRYTLGYEYEIDKRAFLTLELFGSHVFDKKDYWKDDAWSSGFTIGITTTIF